MISFGKMSFFQFQTEKMVNSVMLSFEMRTKKIFVKKMDHFVMKFQTEKKWISQWWFPLEQYQFSLGRCSKNNSWFWTKMTKFLILDQNEKIGWKLEFRENFIKIGWKLDFRENLTILDSESKLGENLSSVKTSQFLILNQNEKIEWKLEFSSEHFQNQLIYVGLHWFAYKHFSDLCNLTKAKLTFFQRKSSLSYLFFFWIFANEKLHFFKGNHLWVSNFFWFVHVCTCYFMYRVHRKIDIFSKKIITELSNILWIFVKEKWHFQRNSSLSYVKKIIFYAYSH